MKNFLRKLYLVLRYRPLFKCPFCEGKGGSMGCGEEREWSECPDCFEHWEAMREWNMPWFEGRVPLLHYLRARASKWRGMWCTARFIDLFRCWAGFHKFAKFDPSDKIADEFCCICYTPRGEKGGAA